jgi:hypothetical protein
MKKFVLITGILAVAALAGYGGYYGYLRFAPHENPDPNHTHADFALWVHGKQLDFSDPKYMSGLSIDTGSHPTDGLRKFLHLHDGNGHVIHRHKPGMTLQDFFLSLGIQVTKDGLNACIETLDLSKTCENEAEHRNWVMVVNGETKPFDAEYVFADGDKILIVLPKEVQSDELPEVWAHWAAMTDDACKYSKTCPWRGAPPTENCIADPEVPCTM